LRGSRNYVGQRGPGPGPGPVLTFIIAATAVRTGGPVVDSSVPTKEVVLVLIWNWNTHDAAPSTLGEGRIIVRAAPRDEFSSLSLSFSVSEKITTACVVSSSSSSFSSSSSGYVLFFP